MAKVRKNNNSKKTSIGCCSNPSPKQTDDVRRRLVVTLNLSKVVQHMWESIITENSESLVPVFDSERPILTGDMRTWYTGKPCEFTKRSHVNFCVYDSTWESSDAFQLDHNGNVDAWAKNDHLGFEILYVFRGVVHKYRPDFIIRLKDGSFLVLETKGQEHRPGQSETRISH